LAECKKPVFVGVSAAMRDLVLDIERAARTDARVLITGESGVGKEIAARFLHDMSARSAAARHDQLRRYTRLAARIRSCSARARQLHRSLRDRAGLQKSRRRLDLHG
jgi:hypothetical protein